MLDCLKRELKFRTSRSSGPGGQHVNRTESRVELLWDPAASGCLNKNQKELVISRLSNKLTDDGLLILASDRFRSQYLNKAEVIQRFMKLIAISLAPPVTRKKTVPTRKSIERRIRSKKIRGELKHSRRFRPEE